MAQPTVYPPAAYAPLPEAATQNQITPVLIILHTIVGSAAGAENVMRGDWYGESHFIAPFNAALRQLMPLDRRADCNWQVNSWATPISLTMADGSVVPAGTICGAISIETEDDGTPEDTPWTPNQVERMAQFIAWAHDNLHIPIDTPDTPFHPGVGYHSLPGLNKLAIWDVGGNPPYGTITDAKGRTVNVYNPWTNTVGKSCPGPARIAQFPEVLNRARQIANSTPPAQEDDMRTLPTPTRIYDSRSPGKARLSANEVVTIPIYANAVDVNITVVRPDGEGFLVAWGENPKPATSNINFQKGVTISNRARVDLDNGTLRVQPSQGCHIIVDLQAAG